MTLVYVFIFSMTTRRVSLQLKVSRSLLTDAYIHTREIIILDARYLLRAKSFGRDDFLVENLVSYLTSAASARSGYVIAT